MLSKIIDDWLIGDIELLKQFDDSRLISCLDADGSNFSIFSFKIWLDLYVGVEKKAPSFKCFLVFKFNWISGWSELSCGNEFVLSETSFIAANAAF